jgi:hypothetical protein
VTLGIKVHIYLLDLADPLTRYESEDFKPLKDAVTLLAITLLFCRGM